MLRAACMAALALISCARAPNAPTPALDGFDWLAGCWLSRDGAVEQWQRESDAAIAATNLFPQSDGTQISQSLRIESQSDGAVTLTSSMSGGEASAYTLTTSAEQEAMFENRANAGPQRVIYRRDGDHLTIILSESLDPGQPEYETRYEACDNAPITP